MPKGENLDWIHCNDCAQSTEHKIIIKHRNREFQDELKDEIGQVYASIDGFKDWYLYECRGCKSVTLKLNEYFSEWADPFDGGTKVEFYPRRKIGSRIKPSWSNQLTSIEALKGHFILSAYQEIYDSLDDHHYLAALTTSRALLETIAIENGDGDLRTFKDKLKVLRDKEFISTKQVEFLESRIYDAGSASMHRSYNPSEIVVHRVIEVIEKLLHTIYIEPLISSELEKEVPSRKKPD